MDQATQILPRARVLRVSYDATGQKLVLTAQPANGFSLTDIAEKLRELGGVHGVAITR
jgi:hypothetical protein